MPTSTSEEQNTFVAQEPPGLSGRHHRVSQPTARIEGFRSELARSAARRNLREAERTASDGHSSYTNPSSLTSTPLSSQYMANTPIPFAFSQQLSDSQPVLSAASPLTSRLENSEPFEDLQHVPVSEMDELATEIQPEADEHLLEHQFSKGSLQMITSHPVFFPLKRNTRGLVRQFQPGTPQRLPSESPPVSARQAQPRQRSVAQRIQAQHLPPMSGNAHDMYRFGTGGADKNIFTGVPTLLPVSTNQMAGLLSSNNDGNSSDASDHASDSEARPHKKARRDRSARTLMEDEQIIILAAYTHFKLLICTRSPFPTAQEGDILAVDAWAAACNELGVPRDNVPLNLKIKSREQQVRSTLKTIARKYVVKQYHFDNNKSLSSIAIEANRVLVESLKVKCAFAHIDKDNLTTLCKNPIFADILEDAWFADAGSDGMRYPAYFGSLIPLVTVALLLTVVENAIDEWTSGQWRLVELRSPVYGPRYLKHLHSLHQWAEYSVQRSQAHICMQRELLQTVRLWASLKNKLTPAAQDDDLSDNDFAASERPE